MMFAVGDVAQLEKLDWTKGNPKKIVIGEHLVTRSTKKHVWIDSDVCPGPFYQSSGNEVRTLFQDVYHTISEKS